MNRDMIARIIDPDAWAARDRLHSWADLGAYDDSSVIDARMAVGMKEDADGLTLASLAKADLAAAPPQAPVAGSEDSASEVAG